MEVITMAKGTVSPEIIEELKKIVGEKYVYTTNWNRILMTK